ncbi:minor capsid protein [Paenibacillus sp. FA6]|uniref:minor capsid protein n=1 Tax=Paenibacillus sp. FA6 TaxID=3413029 RepID=UPI003F654B6F
MAPKSSYWQKRFIKLQEAQLNKGQAYYFELEQQYKIAEASVEKDIARWYQRFADNNEISLVEAKRLLNTNELKEFQWDVMEYVKYGEENALDPQWMKELENASARVHISRLEALKIQTQQQAEVLYGNQTDGIDKLARGIYSDGYYHTAFEIQRGFNVGYDLHGLNEKQLSQVISKPWTADGSTFKDKSWTAKQTLVNSVHTQLTQGIIRGDTPDKAIKAISDQFNVSKNKAGRLIMTESAFFASAAQEDCFKALDVERFEIVATLDNHTSATCQALDGKVFDMKDYEVGVTAPPFHPWCRTCTVPYFDDNEGERAARGIDGKTYYVPSNMKYEDWYDKTIKSNPAAVLEEKKRKNLTSDKNQFTQYKEVLGKYAPKSFATYQDMKYNKPEEWSSMKSLYRDVNWQVTAQKNLVKGTLHKIDVNGPPNSAYDNYVDGKLDSRRYYGRTGKVKLDIHLTDHGNAKTHKIVPHSHDWREIEGSNKVKRDEEDGRELTKGERIANKDAIERSGRYE